MEGTMLGSHFHNGASASSAVTLLANCSTPERSETKSISSRPSKRAGNTQKSTQTLLKPSPTTPHPGPGEQSSLHDDCYHRPFGGVAAGYLFGPRKRHVSPHSVLQHGQVPDRLDPACRRGEDALLFLQSRLVLHQDRKK